MRAAADIERVKDDKAAQAEVDENPFMRRRTIPTNLYAVKRATAVTDAIPSSAQNSSSSQTITSSETSELTTQNFATTDDDLGLLQPVAIVSTSQNISTNGVSWAEYKARMKK
jgi:hypothetical protein